MTSNSNGNIIYGKPKKQKRHWDNTIADSLIENIT